MIRKANDIATKLKAGRDPKQDDPLVITPSPDLDVLGTSGSASVDLRLGTWFMTLRQARMTHLGPDDTMDEAHPQLTKTHYVRFGEKYTLHPGKFVLSSTLEWIRLPKDLAAYVIGKSSWGRRGLIIATATGVHPSFTGCLTLELTNVGELPVCIYPGMAICQLFFHTVETGNATDTDPSQFVCSRKPSLGEIRLDKDPFARKLAAAYTATRGTPAVAEAQRAVDDLPADRLQRTGAEAPIDATTEDLRIALAIRRKWMAIMGFSTEEVEQSCRENPPVAIDDELTQLVAAKRLPEITPPSSELSRRAVKY